MALSRYTLYQLFLYFLKLGTTGFGGPVALVGYMQRDLVESYKWISEDEYNQGLALAQLAPGPLAAQLAIYIGFVHNRLIGATLAGIAFVIPSFLMVLALGWAYVQSGGLPWVQAIFYGIGPAVIGIITISSYKLVKKTIKKDLLLWGIFVLSAVTTFVNEEELIWLILGGGIINWLIKARPQFPGSTKNYFISLVLLQVTVTLSGNSKLIQLGWFFLKAGTFVFGSGLAIVPFLYGGVVKEYQWLTEQQFLDAVAIAMITPGPVVITVGFIGYLIAGFPGACVAAAATFLPCYLFTVIPAPYIKRYGQIAGVRTFVEGITAAAVGAIAGAVGVLAKRQFTDLISASIALSVLLVLIYFKKIPEPLIILIAAAIGLIIKTV